ncbi:unnamed protein product [Camellia sinensis]
MLSSRSFCSSLHHLYIGEVSMGSACCVARKDRTLMIETNEETLQKIMISSPSWSFQWDTQRRVAGQSENTSYEPSHGTSANSSMELNGALVINGSNFSGQGSPLGNFVTPTSQKSPLHEGPSANLMTPLADITLASNENAKVQTSIQSLEIVDSSAPRVSLSVPSSSSFTMPTADPSSSQTCSLPANSTQARRAHHSPRHQLLRQLSDSRILGLKSPNSNLPSEGRLSFLLSTCSDELTIGSQGGSSDGWSTRTFSELVASLQRERCSFDSDFLGSGQGKLSEFSSTFSYSPSFDLQTCGVCSKLLTQKSSWSSELSVKAVLVCGHVYHAECLETMTWVADCYDPPCPICTVGEKQLSKMARKVLRAEPELRSRSNKKICRSQVVDSYHDAELDVLDHQKTTSEEENFPKIEASSSGRRYFAKPFLRRHFSLGSKGSRLLSENNSAKEFGARYH